VSISTSNNIPIFTLHTFIKSGIHKDIAQYQEAKEATSCMLAFCEGFYLYNMRFDWEHEILHKWTNPNARYCEFIDLPETEGVYCILRTFDDESQPKHLGIELLYIGRSDNLKDRITAHEVFRYMKEFYGHASIYFKELSESQSIEKKLINTIKPKFNKQYKNG